MIDAGVLAPSIAAAGAVAAGVVDARTGLIPDALNVTMLLGALGCAAWSGTAPAAACGAATCGGALLALHAATRGRGIGLGDVKLAAALGAGLGAYTGIVALGTAFIAGGAFAAWLLLTRRARRGDTVRFAPFIAAGTIVALASAGRV